MRVNKQRKNPYSNRPLLNNIERRIKNSKNKQLHKRHIKLKNRSIKKRKRRRIFVRLSLLLMLTTIVFVAFIVIVKRMFFTDSPEKIPTIRQSLNEQIINNINPANTKGRKLTSAEMKADLEQLIQSIEGLPKENLKNIDKESYLQAKENAFKQIKTINTDGDFFELIDNFTKFSAGDNAKILDLAKYQKALRNLGHGLYVDGSPYAETLKDPRVKERYSRMIPIKDNTNNKKPTLVKNGNGLILSGLSFEEADIESAKKILPGYLSQAKTASSLTIDLRGIDGSSQSYWLECLAPYLVSGSYHAESYLYFGNGFDKYVDYLSTEEKSENIDLEDKRDEVSYRVPESIRKKIEDTSYQKKLTASVISQRMEIPPEKLILLVDESTKNAAESFADFFKHNGLATLSGNKTYGNAWDLPPFYLKLKHSGYLIAIDITLQQNLNGTSLTKDSGVDPKK